MFVAAVLYGVGARLDEEPELLFKLRHVDHLDLINKSTLKVPTKQTSKTPVLKDEDLSNLFGIEIDQGTAEIAIVEPKTIKSPKKALKKVLAKKSTKKLSKQKMKKPPTRKKPNRN